MVSWLCLGLALALAPLASGSQEGLATAAPHVRLVEGAANLLEGREVRALERGSAGLRMLGAHGRVEAGARSRLELAWRGLASARVHGPAAFELTRNPRLVLESFQRAEVEVRRGTLVVELVELGSLELASGAARIASLPDGSCTLEDRGGRALTFWLWDERPREVGPGQSLRLVPSSPQRCRASQR